MTKEEFEILRFHAAGAYKAVVDKDYEKCYTNLWMLNFNIGLLDREFYPKEQDGS